ncbi:hypothetical protein Trco_007073 [Trichoderma cornu-damae]|uniref:ORC1/DEAH AAA+ ATPase domain-containing protein n=1 Tax=Trichoderma cornu-damae TaxID=654480 RepID=A0A9P8QG22_9HYPO|nr:hypothetical protein Trco_007073 [Trichoderma cornu-damae]
MAASRHERRGISDNRFGDNAVINQGDVHLHLSRAPGRAGVVRIIPYLLNEDLIRRRDLVEKLDGLLPRAPGFYSAALWGLGGSGKTQVALDYAYRRCSDSECCVLWVHADSEATFTSDYRAIGKQLGVDDRAGGSDLLDAVRSSIEAQRRWLLVLDNADDLGLFGVGRAQAAGGGEGLLRYIPRGPQGTILWTSRDGHIRGTLVGSGRGIEVSSMTKEEAAALLATARGGSRGASEDDEAIGPLLEELQRLPLAVSQAGAYMRRTSTTAKEYLDLLLRGTSRWDLLRAEDYDRHRRPGVSNSVLETWKMSAVRIRQESELSYRILHVMAYLDGREIPHELVVAAVAAGQCSADDGNGNGNGNGNGTGTGTGQASELEVRHAVTRLVEFSFLNMRRADQGLRSYEMHKLVQEAARYGLWVQGAAPGGSIAPGKAVAPERRPGSLEAHYSSIALHIVHGVFPESGQASWALCERYAAHAIRVSDWTEANGQGVKASALLNRVSNFLYDQGRWRQKELVDRRALSIRREALGEKHPDTIGSLSNLAVGCQHQGRYGEAEELTEQALRLRREVFGKRSPDAIRSMAQLASIYHNQGRYGEAESLKEKALKLRQAVLGEKHPDTAASMAHLALTYRSQGRYGEAESLAERALELRREVLGEKDPETIRTLALLGSTYHAQRRYDKSREIAAQVLDMDREVLGERHPDTIRGISDIGALYFAQGQYDKAEEILAEVLRLRLEVLGERHPDTIGTMADLATLYTHVRHAKAVETTSRALHLRREVLGEKHPDTIKSMADLAAAHYTQGRLDKTEEILLEVLHLQREVLGERHPATVQSKANLAAFYQHSRGGGDEREQDRGSVSVSGSVSVRRAVHGKARIFKRRGFQKMKED